MLLQIKIFLKLREWIEILEIISIEIIIIYRYFCQIFKEKNVDIIGRLIALLAKFRPIDPCSILASQSGPQKIWAKVGWPTLPGPLSHLYSRYVNHHYGLFLIIGI